MGYCIVNGMVSFYLYLIVVVCCCGSYGVYLVIWLDSMDFMDVNGICGMNDCRNVMRFVDLFYVDCEIRLMSGEYFVYMCIMFWIYSVSFGYG